MGLPLALCKFSNKSCTYWSYYTRGDFCNNQARNKIYYRIKAAEETGFIEVHWKV